ncbi:uncharacterized protein MONOS_13454 [Monocercomonoides exilis]|uniref:uncharacterized protein n=1 Tax=Monocercomonoides exilis TaxID=2049356 RepID=UPI00355A29C1|nr:hypothetical protein MONOS_13454 [Monocercomonoides exilis]|eukprot:MONOS_13454.1-p1 / transcript=MONOS_13454.1 / gene=MONOS_13454 / organism=Monocercomonoides_exilis_PA203 / gene_product=unspecified product / transcript_product=unspecified product / location=Mono_scaffold00831:8747-8980(-) / protein_length=78 / sequence_SO=supercontig / SO=protein_coding / is_pseudo=false
MREQRGTSGGAGGVEGGAGAVDPGAEGAARGGEAGDRKAVLGVQHAAVEDPGRRADLETEDPARGAAEGDGEDQLDA